MKQLTILFCVIIALLPFDISAQLVNYESVEIDTGQTYQTMHGFGAALAYYENWLTSHPKKAEIYDAIFGELSLDILRLRNAYDYDATMIDRAAEFVREAEASLGKPIAVLSTSWGPPGYLKNTGDRKNGGTLKYVKTTGGVEFDYAGFAHWWNKSLDEYNAAGIFPDYISIQNEPDYSATWESCILRPSEVINSTDTLAGYNKALDAVYDSIQRRSVIPRILGPETVGIGYNSVQNYINALDLTKLYGIGHHLYHGVNENDPYASADFSKVGNLHPEIPHFQTEFSRGNWWSLAGLIYMSLYAENATAYLYWDLIWEGTGLVSLDYPWDRSRWKDPNKGYTKTKEFYCFKQYSAFIHPGWQRISTGSTGSDSKSLCFINPAHDSAAVILINTSETQKLVTALSIPGYKIDEAQLYLTSEDENCELKGDVAGSAIEIDPLTIATVALKLSGSSMDELVESVNLSASATSIDERLGSLEIQSEVLPASAQNKTLFWQITTGADIAVLSQSGYLQALGTNNGIVTARAIATDGSGIYGEISIELKMQIAVESIQISASAGKINSYKGSIQFNATVLPENADSKSIVWELSEGADIANISEDGLLTAAGSKDGSVTVRASSTDGSDVFSEVTIQVTNQVLINSISIDSDFESIDSYQGSLQLSATVLPENASNLNLFWSLLEGDSLASIDQSGLLKASGMANGIVTVGAEAQDGSGIAAQRSFSISNQNNGTGRISDLEIRLWFNNSQLCYSNNMLSETIDIKMFSLDGSLIKFFTIEALSPSGNFAVENIKPGIYILRARTDMFARSYKILID